MAEGAEVARQADAGQQPLQVEQEPAFRYLPLPLWIGRPRRCREHPLGMPRQRSEQFDCPWAERDRADVARLRLPTVLGADVENRMGPIHRDVGPGEVLEFAHPHAGLGEQFQRIAMRQT